jgi:GTPase SAR1 family protein
MANEERMFKFLSVGGAQCGKNTLVKTFCGVEVGEGNVQQQMDFDFAKVRFFKPLVAQKVAFLLCWKHSEVFSQVSKDVIKYILRLLSQIYYHLAYDDDDDLPDTIRVKAQCWRISGEMSVLKKSIYRSSHCVLICFDLNSNESFDLVEAFMHDADLYAPKHGIRAIVGLKKSDESKKGKERIRKKLEIWRKSKTLSYFEVSAKENPESVFQMFHTLIEKVEDNLQRSNTVQIEKQRECTVC